MRKLIGSEGGVVEKINLENRSHKGVNKLIFIIKSVFNLFWKAKPKLLITIFAIETLLGLLIYPSLYLEKLILDKIVSNIGNQFWQASLGIIITLFLLKAFIELVTLFLNRISGLINSRTSREFSNHMEIVMAEKLNSLDMNLLEDSKFRDKFAKIEKESGRRTWGIVAPLSTFINSIFSLASSILLIISVKPILCLIIILCSIPGFFIDIKYIRKEYQLSEQFSGKLRMSGLLYGYLYKIRSLLEFKILNISQFFIKKLKSIQHELIVKDSEVEYHRIKDGFVTNIIPGLFDLLIGIYLAIQAITVKITIGSMEMTIRAISTFRTSIDGLSYSTLEFYENYLYVCDLVWFLNLKPKVPSDENRDSVPRQGMPDGIEFKNVWFRYKENGPWILKNMSFKIEAKQNIALVGENGSGKSTMIKLLCRFYDPQKGEILIDGQPINSLSRKNLWKRISVLFQDFETYPFSAKETIGYGDIDRLDDLESIKKAAHLSSIDKFIEDLPKQYSNPLSAEFDKGVDPSGGQWQRLALARTLFRNAEIVILDEPTSNVDPKAEEEIFETIIKKVKNQVLILISHRFSTVRRAERILVINRGAIVEQGTHQELMKKNGDYARLFKLQAKGYQS